ncbi:hypothetical protein CA12_03240 [Alienimonas californiensis]|uniref:Uncharacterized protein n=2 Tax=Alienimonas californiensis TaxID=2527989 RepID=A0A517P4G5_9PLAN|nr:hypothetical protein CA12_03240 [Alienimonas californiensis]
MGHPVASSGLDGAAGGAAVCSSSLRGRVVVAAGGGRARDAVANMDLSERFEAALRMAPAKLSGALREEFEEVLSPTNIAIVVGVLVVWAGAHATPVGWIADVALFLAGLVALGWEAWHAARLLWGFVDGVRTAETRADLDAAADKLAQVVVIVGVGALIALVTRGAGRSARAGRASAAAGQVPRFRRVAQRLGLSRLAPKQEAGLRTAIAFMEEYFPLSRRRSQSSDSFRDAVDDDLAGYIRGIDLSEDVVPLVGRNALPTGTRLIGYRQVWVDRRSLQVIDSFWDSATGTVGPTREFGKFYTDPGTPRQNLGIADGNVLVDIDRLFELERAAGKAGRTAGDARAFKDALRRRYPDTDPTDLIVERQQLTYHVHEPTPALQSRTSATRDAWSTHESHPAAGGGIQYMIPDAEKRLRILHRQDVTTRLRRLRDAGLTNPPVPGRRRP